jgi:outer membrane protein W
MTKAAAFDIRLGISAYGGVAIPAEKYVQHKFLAGLRFHIIFEGKFDLALDGSSWGSQVEENQTDLMAGKLDLFPLFVSVTFSPLKGRLFSPYFLAGQGLVFSRFFQGGYISIPEVTVSQKVKSGIGYVLGLGADIRIESHLFLSPEILHLWRKAEGETTYYYWGSVYLIRKFTVDLDSAILRIGLRYVF